MSSTSAAEWIDVLVNLGYFLAAALAVFGGILALKGEKKVAGVLLLLGGTLWGIEMLVWVADMLTSYIRTGSTWETSIVPEALFSPLLLMGALGTLMVSAGVVILAFLYRAAYQEIGNLRRMGGS